MSLFLTRYNNEEEHVPSSNDFIVYQIKKNYKMKVFRYYQCRCTVSKKKSASSQAINSPPKPSAHVEPPNIPIIEDPFMRQLIQAGVIQDIPLSMLDNNENQCLKTFSSLSKFYSHLRIHTNEKPYVCQYPGCKMRFNQKGNLQQHITLVHKKKESSG